MKKYILFGAGQVGVNALNFFGKENVRYFCDNAIHGDDDRIEGIPVISAGMLPDIIDDNTVIVITTVRPKNVLEIARQLDKMHLTYECFDEVTRPQIYDDLSKYTSMNKRKTFEYDKDYEYIISTDRYSQAGEVSSYFWQDLWAAKRINNVNPELHYDIGSRIDGFIAHLLTFGQRVSLIDIRPLEDTIPGVDFKQADATNLETINDASIESISALCSLEHFGLGRYGDPIDPEACFKCFAAIQKKIKPGGLLYISVPIGKEHLEFNAHRVFQASTIIDSFNEMELLEFSSCCRSEYEEDVDIHKYDEWMEYGGDRFGLFMFRKKGC